MIYNQNGPPNDKIGLRQATQMGDPFWQLWRLASTFGVTSILTQRRAKRPVLKEQLGRRPIGAAAAEVRAAIAVAVAGTGGKGACKCRQHKSDRDIVCQLFATHFLPSICNTRQVMGSARQRRCLASAEASWASWSDNLPLLERRRMF